MEFKEFDNPESVDYDIKSSKSNDEQVRKEEPVNPYYEKLWDLIGILEDVTDEDIQRDYGISEKEYLNPTAETIEKVKRKLSENENKKHL